MKMDKKEIVAIIEENQAKDSSKIIKMLVKKGIEEKDAKLWLASWTLARSIYNPATFNVEHCVPDPEHIDEILNLAYSHLRVRRF
jgi:hypothetical protein